ncbi:Xaa-Pro peptidase family protein [Candidatus Micrarchaeota archaeon]|nr:Xaa-Pro peptidase family protein [Candidatus Micrarchaeota archaeon]
MNPQLKTIWNQLPDSTEGILLLNEGKEDANFFYCTGITEGMFDGSAAWITRNCIHVFTPRLDAELAKKQLGNHISISVYGPGNGFSKLLRERIGKPESVAYNDAVLPVKSLHFLQRLLPKTQWIPASNTFQKIRSIKTPQEIRRIQKAIRWSEKALQNILDQRTLKSGVREFEAVAALEYEMRKLGSEPAFPTIFAFGKNAAQPHHPPGVKRLQPRECVLIDFGARYQKYCADISRSFVLGPPSAKQKRMYSIVEKAQSKAKTAVHEGVNARFVHQLVEKEINATEFRNRFNHATGHSLGLEVHDGLVLSTDSFDLKKGMVFTLEPGVYVPGVGGVRIEDDVEVTKNGFRQLTRETSGLQSL